MKRLIFILTLFLFFINTSVLAADKITKQDIKVVTKDGFSICATLEYPKIKGKNEYSTVVLLHSLGYSSVWWETLPQELLDKGYAVIQIDLRGHGKSVYNSKLIKVSYKSLTNKAFSRYPSDVIAVLDYVKNENKRIFFDNWAIVGADIGASAGIIAANTLPYKPATLVLLSPVTKAKSLYIPVHFAEMENVDTLSISGVNDTVGLTTQNYLKKFAQSTFTEYTSSSSSTGMMLLKNDKSLSKVITEWLGQYLKNEG